MSFLPAILLPSLKIRKGYGGIAANVDGTLIALVDSMQNCVYIFSVDGAGERTADPIVIGSHGTSHGQLDYPVSACFVRRKGVDTVLICDWSNKRVVETTARGVFMRTIMVNSNIICIAYCGVRDVIAVSEPYLQRALLLQYESGNTVCTTASGTDVNFSLENVCLREIKHVSDFSLKL